MNILELEQELLNFSRILDDIEVTTEWFCNDEKWSSMDSELHGALMDKYLGIKELYEIRFQICWDSFEKVCKEYHEYRKIAEQSN